MLVGLDWIIDIISSNHIPYQITGGLAVNLYGSSRLLYDIDIEVRDNDVWKLSELCKEYIVYYPSRYVDEYFDLLLMTLNYNGQLIDVCGIDSMSIRGERQYIDLSSAVVIRGYGVVRLEDLVAYKRLLGRDVDLQDIKHLSSIL